MNYSIIIYILCRVLELQGLFLALPCLVALIYREKSGWAYFAVMIFCFAVGWIGRKKKASSVTFFAREGFVTVTLSWIILSLTGALPFYFSGEMPVFTNALFETVSGLTTTAATVLGDVEGLSYCSLFWRSFSNWVGGMGILVFMMTILPLVEGYNMHLLRAESPGPKVGKLVPRIKHTARILYGIYIGITVTMIVLLFCSGLNLFESLTLTFATAGTGGFSILNSSVSSYPYGAQAIIAIFLLLFGINFNVFYLFLAGKPKEAVRQEELRYFFIIIFIATVLVTWNIRGYFSSFFSALHQASFQVISFITTAGYVTHDYSSWPVFSQTILIMLTFIGSCAASTGGGIKISRIVILLKLIKNEISHRMHPKRVKQIRFENRVISEEVWRAVLVFLVAYVLIFAISLLVVSLSGFDFATNFSAVAAAMNNAGTGMNRIGPDGNFSIFSNPVKWMLMFDMLIGRLEIFPVLVFLTPSTWKRV